MRRVLVAGMVIAVAVVTARAAEPDAKDVKALVDKAIEALKTRQNEDGSFAPKLGGPGVTAMVVAGLIRNGVSPDEPLVAKALAYFQKQVKPDGGI